jgi:hypothetical protein
MAIVAFHGFEREQSKLSAKFLSESVDETLLIEVDDVFERWDEIQDALPAYGAASGNMPDGSTITFTLGRSPHPHRSRLILREASPLKKVPNSGTFWTVKLRYEMDISDQETEDPADPQNSNVIVLPWQRPPQWQASAKIVEHETFDKPNGDAILHTNNLPLNKPISVPLQHTTHTFTWNIKWAALDYDRDLESYANRMNKQTMWEKPPGTWKLTNISASEAWERIPFDDDVPGEYSFHFARVTASFEYNPEGWNKAPYSKSTYAYSAISLSPLILGYAPIPVNSRGDLAKEPWPLKDDGFAVDYNDINDRSQYARLDTGWTADDQPGIYDIYDFASRWNLNVPGVTL